MIAFDKTLTLFILPSLATNDEQSLIKTLPIRGGGGGGGAFV